MPRYILKPVDLNHPDWKASSHKDRCRVTAPDEAAARAFADSAFRTVTRRSQTNETPSSVWRNPDHVKIEKEPPSGLLDVQPNFPPKIEVPENVAGERPMSEWGSLVDVPNIGTGQDWIEHPSTEFLEQAVQYLRNEGYRVDDDGNQLPAEEEPGAPESSSGYGEGGYGEGPFGGTDATSIQSDTPPSAGTAPQIGVAEHSHETGVWGKSKWGGAVYGDQSASTPQNSSSETENHKPTKKSYDDKIVRTNSEVVSKVRQNKTEFKIATISLLRFLDDINSGSVRTDSNADPFTGNADRPEELIGLLQEIRDELRRFNDLLDADINSPKLEKSTIDLRKVLMTTLITFGGTLGYKMGGLLAPILTAYLLQFGQSLDLPPIDPEVLEQLKAVAEISEQIKKD